MKTKAAVLHEMALSKPYAHSQPLRIQELELDPPGPNEVLIKIGAAGLCHSDLSVINGSRPRPLPMALGHEAAGEIIEVGSGVKGFEPGDHVVCVFVPSCGHCLPCRKGRPALCEPGAQANAKGEMLDGGIRLHDHGDDIKHHIGVSGFAQYAVVSENSIVKVDPSIPFEKLAVFGCAVITGVGAVVNTAKIEAGSTVAVVGLGGVGLAAVLGAIMAGASQVIALDVNAQKLQLAQELGATACFNVTQDDVLERIQALTPGGVDYAIETAGVVTALEMAYAITCIGGTTVTAGLPDPKEKFAVQQVSLTAQERTIKGSYVGSCVPMRDIPRFIELYKQGRLPVDKLITDVLKLEDINEGFDRLDQGQAARLIVTMD
ncbi:zinc-dependent alcohol dehydrogenase family protein [Brackiella oedipodis]|uniref:zinc-dependent alcohol dehydrogenase family protein n=1 Tax=Brackiella oedipodis TaxID=124225 RepID=UPI00048D8093|nr:zinc-dependent alcohol dehydrogenase family protein [Brackiella oedipodis]